MDKVISTLLNLPNQDSWEILDSNIESSLYLIHYTPDAPMNLFGHLSGLVLDTEAGVVVAKDYGYTPLLKGDNLEVDEVDNKIHLISATNPDKEYKLDPEKTSFLPGFDGLLVRVFLHNGKVYHSTRRRLNMGDLRVYSGGPTYQEMYYTLGGPNNESLFDLSKKYSPFVHTFLMADPLLQGASKNPIGAGYLIYLGTGRMWEESPYASVEVEMEPKILAVETKFVPNPTLPRLYSPPVYNISRASKFLRRGFTKEKENTAEDPRLLPGEFIMAYIPEENQVYRIESPAYRWRSAMLDESTKKGDLYEQYFILGNGKFMRLDLPPEREVYLRRFPLLTPYSIEDLRGMLPIREWPQDIGATEEIPRGQELQLYNIFLGFLYSVPLPDQEYVLEFYDRYWEDITRARDWLINLYREGTYYMDNVPREAKRLIGASIGFAQEEVKKGDITRDIGEIIENNIEQLINAEEGRSLYRIVQSIPE